MAAVHQVATSRTRLSDFTFTFHFHTMEKVYLNKCIKNTWLKIKFCGRHRLFVTTNVEGIIRSQIVKISQIVIMIKKLLFLFHRLRIYSFTSCYTIIAEKAMATHSSVLAWRTPGTAEPGGLPSMGSHRVGHDWSDLSAAAWVSHNQKQKQGPDSYLCAKY